jgi:hypothetical protein
MTGGALIGLKTTRAETSITKMAAPPIAIAGVPKKAIKALPLHWNLFAGACAGTTEILVMFPLDVVKTRFQLQVGTGGQYTSIFQCLRSIIKEEGLAKLYRGIAPPILTEAPKRAVKFGSNGVFLRPLCHQKWLDPKLIRLFNSSGAGRPQNITRKS